MQIVEEIILKMLKITINLPVKLIFNFVLNTYNSKISLKKFNTSFLIVDFFAKGPHRPDAISQRGAIFHFSKRNKSVYNTKLWHAVMKSRSV